MTAGCLGPCRELREKPCVRLEGGGPITPDALKQLAAMLEERATEAGDADLRNGGLLRPDAPYCSGYGRIIAEVFDAVPLAWIHC